MQRLVETVLAAWREAERVVSQTAAGSRERRDAELALERLRDLYQKLTLEEPIGVPQTVQAGGA